MPRQRVHPTLRFASSPQPPFPFSFLFVSFLLFFFFFFSFFFFASRFCPLFPFPIPSSLCSATPVRPQVRDSSEQLLPHPLANRRDVVPLLSLSLSFSLSRWPSSYVARCPVHVFVRECDRAGIPMLIKRNTDPRYLSHAWRRSAALRRLPISFLRLPSHEPDEYIYKW